MRSTKPASKKARSTKPASAALPYSSADIVAAADLQRNAAVAFRAAAFIGAQLDGAAVKAVKDGAQVCKSGGQVSLLGSASGRANGGVHESKSLAGRGFIENGQDRETRLGLQHGSCGQRFFPLGPALAAAALQSGKISAADVAAARAAVAPPATK